MIKQTVPQRDQPVIGSPEIYTLATGHVIMAMVAGLTRVVLWFRYFLTNTAEVEPKETEELLAICAVAVHLLLAALCIQLARRSEANEAITFLYFLCVGFFLLEAIALIVVLGYLPLGVLAWIVLMITAISPLLDRIE